MKRRPVDSTLVTSLGYNRETATLEIEFRSGTVYRYFAVPNAVYRGFRAAESKGSFFNDEIKGVFPYEQLI